MEPVTLTAISMGASALGGVVGAIGAKGKGEAEAQSLRLQGQAKGEQYEAQAKAYMYKAGVAEMNRKLKLADADYARWAGETEATQSGMKTKFAVGTVKAKQAGSGLEVDFGSGNAVRDSMLEIGRYDQSMIRHNAARKAYGYEVEAASQEAEKNLDVMSAESSTRAAMFTRMGGEQGASAASTAGDIGALTSILGASGSVASKWIQGSSLGNIGSTSQANPWASGGVGTSDFWGNSP